MNDKYKLKICWDKSVVEPKKVIITKKGNENEDEIKKKRKKEKAKAKRDKIKNEKLGKFPKLMNVDRNNDAIS